MINKSFNYDKNLFIRFEIMTSKVDHNEHKSWSTSDCQQKKRLNGVSLEMTHGRNDPDSFKQDQYMMCTTLAIINISAT